MIRALTVLLLLTLSAVPARAATLVVTTTSDSGPGSLHQAILDANATVEHDTIEFSFINITLRTIAGNLPPITNPVTIDGYSVDGAEENTDPEGSTSANLRIRLSATAVTPADVAVLDIQADDTTIRGLIINDVPSGVFAIHVAAGATGVKVQGCFLGTNGSGLGDATSGDGIRVSGSALIGGDTVADRNLIAGNRVQVELLGANSIVVDNLIGVNSNGDQMLFTDQTTGVRASGAGSTGNRVGGTGPLDRNVIAWHGGAGIEMTSSAQSLAILGNSIRDNGGLGIDLAPLGEANPNDEGDADSGPNDLQNFPVLTFARVNEGELRVEGYLDSGPGSYRVELFRNAAADESGFGEGAQLVSSEIVEIPEGETVTHFVRTIALEDAEEALVLTATATDVAAGETSEFGRAAEAVQGGSELVVTNTNDAGAGSLRGAIEAANANADTNTIVFQIPSEGVQTISVGTPIVITEPVIIDGYTQATATPNTLAQGSNANVLIELDGSASENAPLLDVRAGATIRGLIVGGSAGNGIELRAAGSVIEGNLVGTDAAGGDLGNAGAGIAILEDASGNTVGGPEPHQGNVIARNDGDGVEVTGGSGNRIVGNSIQDNGGLGIDLGTNGVTPNDTDDADDGPNRLQNFPVLTLASNASGTFEIEGTLETGASGEFLLSVYEVATCDASGHGEGRTHVGSAVVTVDGSGGFSTALDVVVDAGSIVTATMTDAETGDTSEFSECFTSTEQVSVCGDATGDDELTASDALSALRTAVGTANCAECVCNVNSTGGITTTDALLILRASVGQTVELDCPDCG